MKQETKRDFKVILVAIGLGIMYWLIFNIINVLFETNICIGATP
ncbi:MAG: hypothetical protein ACE5ES_06070 [Candidatus Nanoarchaeia archaeon]